MQAVLMVAGKSTRTYPLTLSRPKPLLPLLNRPLIEHSLDQMVGVFDEVILIVGYRREMIRESLGKEYRGIRLIYREQKEQLGTGHAVLQARDLVDGRFVVMNGDDLFAHNDLARLVTLNNGALVKEVEDPSLYGVYRVDDQNRVLEMVEKPKTFVGNLANIGCYVFESDIFEKLERTPFSERGEIEIVDAILETAHEKSFQALPIEGFWLPTGYAWDLLAHQEFLARSWKEAGCDGQVEDGAVLKGPVQIGLGTVVKSGAYIEGPVVIGQDCIIGPNCAIRGTTSIGDRCRVGHAVEIKNSLVMSDSMISHLSYIGDSVIGAGCNVGAGTLTANKRHDSASIVSMIKGNKVDSKREKLGSILADGCQTGIHTSFYPGVKIWPEQTTRPGDIVKSDVMPKDREW